MRLSFAVAPLALLLALAWYSLAKRVRHSKRSRQHRCEDPPSYKHQDPLFGLDLFLNTGKRIRENTYLPAQSDLFRRYGNTFEALSLGRRRIYTVDPDNIRTVFTGNFQQWGVQPIRLAPMAPFCGKGFLTVDGALWHKSRKLFQPSFEKEVIADFSALERFLQRMLAKVPGDGTDVDMQPLLARLVST